jgi:hypothetical protein
MTLTLSTGEAWAPRINGRTVSTASESEKYRASLALQIALAQVSGLKFLVVDGIDVLDLANRKTMLGMLEQAIKSGSLDQAVITSTLGNEAALTAKYPDWLRMYHVVKGDAGSSIAPPPPLAATPPHKAA